MSLNTMLITKKKIVFLQNKNTERKTVVIIIFGKFFPIFNGINATVRRISQKIDTKKRDQIKSHF